MKLLILNGPNLDMLGVREPDIYGDLTLAEINDYIENTFKDQDVTFEFFQSNHEGELVEKIHSTHDSDIDGIVYNPGAHTHYSYALRDAVSSVSTPVIEVHLSDIKSRDEFRKKSVIAFACEGQISGLGKDSYVKAIEIFLKNEGDVLWQRSVKTDEEVETLKEAQKIADKAFFEMFGQVKSGMTELEVKDILEKAMLANGAEGFSFPTIVGTGPNAADPHAIAGENVLDSGQSVVIDFGVIYKGMCSDTTRTIFVGRPHGELLRAWLATKDAHETVAREVKIGMTGKQCHDRSIEVIDDYGFAGCMPHGLGHGVGRDIHEKPVLSPRCRAKLVKNNIITIEPGVYIQGKFGIRLEDCGVLTENGFESFTSITHDLIVID
ncbi:MAG: type II 3-dehydroquinate dehydratase [Phoenicibacter congonensis]|uniref:3-dehydroquinate dehydratase n=1 Tax=Phoenicibacter congonensis TaxID=1944646 RepID=A0AA43UAU7_9ACTN|nr:type II 3-dehydroquinate dehydratase [Phoenicibacter congonensis]